MCKKLSSLVIANHITDYFYSPYTAVFYPVFLLWWAFSCLCTVIHWPIGTSFSCPKFGLKMLTNGPDQLLIGLFRDTFVVSNQSFSSGILNPKSLCYLIKNKVTYRRSPCSCITFRKKKILDLSETFEYFSRLLRVFLWL